MAKGRMLALSEHVLVAALCLMELVQLFEDELLLLKDPLPGPSDMHMIDLIALCLKASRSGLLRQEFNNSSHQVKCGSVLAKQMMQGCGSM